MQVLKNISFYQTPLGKHVKTVVSARKERMGRKDASFSLKYHLFIKKLPFYEIFYFFDDWLDEVNNLFLVSSSCFNHVYLASLYYRTKLPESGSLHKVNKCGTALSRTAANIPL